MATKIPAGYTWVRNLDPEAVYDSKAKIVTTKDRVYTKDEYLLISDRAYVPEPYASKYKNPKQLEGIQHDPSQMKAIDFKQDYTVLIRKKSYYAITQGNDENYISIFQINNFTNLRTSIDVYGGGSASLAMKGAERVVVSTKQNVKDTNWKSFQEVLQGWNTIEQEKFGEVNGVQYNNLQRTREKVYDWAYAEKCDFEPMDEIYIFSKSPNRNSKGEYPFEQIFFGYLTSISKVYTAGASSPSISISANDQLKLLSISRMANKLPVAMNVGGTAYRFDGIGNFIVETDPFYTGIDMNNKNPDGSYNPAPAQGGYVITNMFSSQKPQDIIKQLCIEAGIPEKYLKNRIESINRVPFLDGIGTDYDLYVGSFRSRLDMCKESAEKLNLEFFADESGNIVLKIPTYNIGINRLKNNNLNIDVPVIVDENSNKVLKLETLHVSTEQPDLYYLTVQTESLYDIARKFLNNGSLWTNLWILNPHIKDSNFVPKGTRILISDKVDVTQKIDKTYSETIKETATSYSGLTDRYIPVIYPEQIVSFTFTDSDKEVFTAAQVTIEVPLMMNQMAQVPEAVTRAVGDLELIKKFGFRDHPQTSTPIVKDPHGAAIYAGLLLVKSISNRYTGSITIIENSSIKVGNPVRFLLYDENPFHEIYAFKEGNDNSYAQAVFYVDAIERNINVNGVSFMTLNLRAGRMMGMPSIYDQCQELYRYFYDDNVDRVDLSKPVEATSEVKTETTTVTKTTSSTPTTPVKTETKTETATKKSNDKPTTKPAEVYGSYNYRLDPTFTDYLNKKRGRIFKVPTKQEINLAKTTINAFKHQNLVTYPLTYAKVAALIYGSSDSGSMLERVNDNQPDGTGSQKYFSGQELKAGQLVRLPYPKLGVANPSFGKYIDAAFEKRFFL